MRKIAIIGGSGVKESLSYLGLESEIVHTPFGNAAIEIGNVDGNQVCFLARHGVNHVLPPHKINYHANIWALKKLGTEEILATTAVGSLNKFVRANELIVCDQFIDFTKNRTYSFFNGEIKKVAHVDFTEPFCPTLRARLCKILQDLHFSYYPTGCYACMEGPRYESKAEVQMLSQLGAQVVGMTLIPEVLLAREAEICYVNCSVITNMGAGISPTPLTHAEVTAAMEKMNQKVLEIFKAFIDYPEPVPATCPCKHALKDYGGFHVENFE